MKSKKFQKKNESKLKKWVWGSIEACMFCFLIETIHSGNKLCWFFLAALTFRLGWYLKEKYLR